MENYNVIEGIFRVIIFRSDNQFTVAKFKVNDKEEKTLTVTGYLREVLEDTPYRLYGTYKEHPRYGMQFEIASYERVLPTDENSLIRYFSSSLFPHVGKKAAERIVRQLGNDALSLLKKDINIVYQIAGLSLKQIESIKEGIDQNASLDDSIVFLTQNGMSLRNIMKVEAVYENPIEVIKNNPYQMIIDVDGIGFKTADKIASNIGFEENHPYRMKAAIVSVMNTLVMNSGNAYTNKKDIALKMKQEFHFDNEQTLDSYLDELVMERLIHIEDNDYYPIAQYDAEKGIAAFLSQFPYCDSEYVDKTVLLEELEALEKKYQIVYETKQKEAIMSFFDTPFSIITGGPGTGKTTIVRAIIALYEKMFPIHKIALCAPTGRASKRLTDLSQVEACTIHSLLKWDLDSNTFGMNENDPLDVNLLVIDEFSMVDAWLFYNVLKASHFVGKILLIGDEDQLPSVGPGFVLRDLIASNCFKVSRLEKIFRQQSGSDVVKLANDIKNGCIDTLERGNDVKMFPALNYQIKDLILSVVQNAFDKGYTINDIQLLAPMYNGVAGIDALNRALQELCNPSSEYKKEIKAGYRLFREQDKILQLKNQPDDGVYNGDIGILVEIVYANDDFDHQDRIIVDFDGIEVEYTRDNFYMITHAYCISVHKSQGSEYPIVVMPIVKDYAYMLERRLIYTGITRAKKSLVLLGDKEMLLKGINKEERHPRKTKLKERLLFLMNK